MSADAAPGERGGPLGWNLYSGSPYATRPFAYVAAGDIKHPLYGFVAPMDRTPRPRDPRWHVVLRRLKARAERP